MPQPTNFFDSVTQGGDVQLPVYMNANVDEPSIFFSSLCTAISTPDVEQQVDMSLSDLPIIDLSGDQADHGASTMQEDDQTDQTSDPQSFQFFDIPADIPVLSTGPHHTEAQFLGY